MASDARHEPVLAAEVVALLAPRPGGVYVDCTAGLGGHAAALIAAGAGRVVAIDRDAAALEVVRERLSEAGARLTLVHADYRELGAVLAAQAVTHVDGVLADLGVSSWQLEDPKRGFSFRQAGPLDMRMDQSKGPTLEELLDRTDEAALADVIYQFGEERRSRRVARAVLDARRRGQVRDTAELAAVVRRAVGGRGRQRIDPATRTFQALRIWVNAELDRLEEFLETAIRVLGPGGRAAVIAFHSLEDRIVKHAFRRMAADGRVVLLTRRPVVPKAGEVERNPRARSARLRAVEKAA